MIFAVTLVLTLFLGLNMISASDVNFDNTVSLTDNNIKITSSNIDIDDVVEEINNNENVRTPNTNAGRGQVVKNGNNVLNFSSLNETINSGEAELILLDNDYTYDNSTDSRFKDLGGIVISRNLTIDGQGLKTVYSLIIMLAIRVVLYLLKRVMVILKTVYSLLTMQQMIVERYILMRVLVVL